MTRLLIIAGAIVIVILYVAVVNQSFLRCPHCRKIGAWRFDDLESPRETVDEQGNLIRTEQRQRCSRCKNSVLQVWSDDEGRSIIPFKEK